MKKFKKVIIVGLVVVALAATSLTAFAFTGSSTPAEIMANITGKTVEEVTNQKFESNLTYGELAFDEEVWEEFQDEMLENKKVFLDERVADGTLTQEDADEIYNNMKERHEYIRENGAGFGGMMGFKNSNGFGGMMGYGNNQGRGCGRAWQ